MWATTIILDSGSRYKIVRRSELPLGWQLHLCPDYKTPPVRAAGKNHLQISSGVITIIRFESYVFKAIFLAANFLSVEVLNETQFVNGYVISICYIDRHLESTNCKIPLLGSTPNESIGIYRRWLQRIDYGNTGKENGLLARNQAS